MEQAGLLDCLSPFLDPPLVISYFLRYSNVLKDIWWDTVGDTAKWTRHLVDFFQKGQFNVEDGIVATDETLKQWTYWGPNANALDSVSTGTSAWPTVFRDFKKYRTKLGGHNLDTTKWSADERTAQNDAGVGDLLARVSIGT
ncbi:hypothetical protein P154DRAFT_271898 [Amniculicola lignicola CBS 123094]|uniref:Uncharacterized protein n=1 Tax=Amniculicola lignicola CBS 123094 TaxID=1392246 RepID=A0A6A5W8R2_9PLEO|nr:hypothetical protein P154DRAFT_271898 [Amniculicola lignicola CBS 123094]